MANVNTVTVSGNLTRDPETRWTAEDGSSSIVSIGIAVNRSRKNGEGEYVDEVSFFDIDVFGAFANLVARKLRKGDAAVVNGRLEQQRYEKDGEAKSQVKIVATQIDSPGLFRSKDEDNGKGETAAVAAETMPTATPSDDDIPF